MKTLRKLLILLIAAIWLIPDPSYAGFISKDRTTTYQINFDLNWMQKFVNLFLKYEFLSWREATLQELFVKDNEDLKAESESELIIVSITPKNFNEALFLRNAGGIEGFLRFIKRDNLSIEGTQRLLEIINYIYIPQEGQEEFRDVCLLEKDPDRNSTDWSIVKTKSNDQYIINIQIRLTNYRNPIKKDIASVTIALNPLEKVFERVKLEIKGIGLKFELIKKPVS